MDTWEAYRELGADPDASDAELKAIWRRLVGAWHPDRNPAADASLRMQQINKAYQFIRQLRDSGSDGSEEGERAGNQSEPPFASSADRPHRNKRTHFTSVNLSMEDAILGCTRTLRGHHSQVCVACLGTGHCVTAKGCQACGGKGAVRKAALFGWVWNDEPCTDCGGDGRQRNVCGDCSGSGTQTVAYRRRVRFPAGVRNGHVLSVPASGQGALEVDLELDVKIEPHPLFTMDNDGLLRCEMPVNGYAWMAGRWVEVPTPDGLQQMRLNRNALSYRLSGKGFPVSLRGPRGDYFVKVVPVFPSKEDPAQEALLDQLIAKSDSSIKSDRSQPLGQWRRHMKRWSAQQKDGHGTSGLTPNQDT